MKLSIPAFIALMLLLVTVSFIHAEAVSAASEAASMMSTGPAILTSTITTTGAITTATITGVILNGSGTNLPGNLPVTLYGYQPGPNAMNLVMTTTTTAQSDGAFTFNNVAKPSGSVFMASATYAGVPYHSTPSIGEPMTITVFDVTTATNHLMADQLHLIFSISATGDLEVMEVYILTNVGTQTIVSSQEGQLMMNFPLPEGALNPDFRSGAVGEDLETHDGFLEIPAVRPGGLYGVSYAFSLSYAGNKATLNQPIALPVSAVGALLPVMGNLKIEGAGLVDNGPSNFGSTSYHVYSGASLRAGDQLAIKISGNPNAPASSAKKGVSGSRQELIIGLGVFGLVLILAGVWISRRSRANAMESETDIDVIEEEQTDLAAEETTEPADAETLMDDIIALDDLYQAGELPESAYRERRAELKEQLRAIVGDKE